MKSQYTNQEIETIMKQIPRIKGWDFSFMKTKRQPVPWDYTEVVKLYLSKSDNVLDIGTGGGEQFSKLSNLFHNGIGIDVDDAMIDVANESRPSNINYYCDDNRLTKVTGSFNIILNRHAPLDLQAIPDKLKKNGYFITQQVGEKNMRNIYEIIGKALDIPVISPDMFNDIGLKVIAFLEYNVNYTVLNIESLLFWLNSLDMLHTGFDSTIATKDVTLLNKVVKNGLEKDVFVTNEHRFLVVAQKL